MAGLNSNPIIDSRYIDSSGFLIGQRRLKELSDNVKQIDRTTVEILNILRGELKQQAAETQTTLNSIEDILKKISARDTIRISNSPSVNTQDTPAPSNSLGRQTRRITRSGDNSDQSSSDSQNNGGEQANASRNRNRRGQFGSDEPGGSSDSRIKGLTTAIRAGFENIKGPDTRGVDPTVEAMHEISQVISPAGRAFKAMGKGALWLFGRRKPKDEALPSEQSRHNRTNERQMERLIDAIRRRGSSALGGIGSGLGSLGGFFGRGAKGAGRFGLKALRFLRRAPVIGSIIGAAMLGQDLYNSKTAEDKGRAIGKFGGGVGGAAAGAVIGTAIFPGVGTAIGAVLGGVLGSTVGDTIGGKFGEWTTTLMDANIPDRIMGAWSTFTTGLSKYFQDKQDKIFNKAEEVRDSAFNWLDKGRAWLGNSEAKARVEINKKYGHSNVPAIKSATKKPKTKAEVLEKATLAAQNWNAGNIDGLSDAATRRLVASTLATESSGGDLGVVNQQGYMGRYQAGASWLADAGLIKGGADAVKASMKGYKREWNWAKSGGMSKFLKNKDNWVDGMSYEKYLSDAAVQDAAFQNVTSKSYQQLLAQGALNGKNENQIAGLLKSAHLGGVNAALTVSKGGTGIPDANDTTPKKYYDDIVHDRDGLKAIGLTKSRSLPTQPTKSVGMTQPVIPQPAQMPKVPEMPIINKQIGSKPPQIVQLAANPDNIGQNVSDRQIAHAVTGGLGMRQYD